MDGVYAGFAGAKTCHCLSILVYKYYAMIKLASIHRFSGRSINIILI